MRTHATRERSQPKSLRTFVLFCSVVLFLIVLSLGFKTVKILQESKFNEENRFTIALVNEKSVAVYSVNPDEHSLSQLTITGEKKIQSISRYLGIPIDATVVHKKGGEQTYTPKEFFQALLFRPFRFKTDLTIADTTRLFLLTRAISEGDLTVESLPYPLEPEHVDDVVRRLFQETLISDENASIEIINASGVPGLGSRMERMLVNTGATVIAVSSAQKLSAHSSILYTLDDSPTLRRISSVLHFRTQLATKKAIGDITITIGEDMKEATIF